MVMRMMTLLLVMLLNSWQVECASVLPLVPGASTRVFPSPDGRTVAFHRAVRLNSHEDYFVCLSDAVEVTEPNCIMPPQELPRGFEADPNSYFFPFTWSPDGIQLAAVGQPLITLTDTDLWLLDTTTGEWTTLGEDGYEGPLSATDTAPAPPAGVTVDVQPTWSPDGTQIAVERTSIKEEGKLALSTLSVLDVASGEVRDLTPLPGHETHETDAGSVTGISWSPDGSTLALSIRHREGLDAGSDGIWLVNAESGELELLVSVEQVTSAWQTVYAAVALDSIGPLSWSPDGTRLLFWAGNATTTPIVVWPFWVTLADEAITALSLPPHPNDSGERRALRPLQATWSPDGTSLLVFAFGLHPDEPVTPLDPAGERPRAGLRLVDVAAGTETLLGNLPLGPATALYIATWGEEGDVVINGYHLLLVPSG